MCLKDPWERTTDVSVGVLLPENLWLPAPPKAKVWVRIEQEYLEMCCGDGSVHFSQAWRTDASPQPTSSQRPHGSTKKDSVLPNGLPILRMIINAIPANAYQELLGGDIAMLPNFTQWNGIQLDREDLVSWSEADMSAAFWIFRMESSWFPLQALAKPVPGSFAAQWRPELGSETLVCPANYGHDDGVEKRVWRLAARPLSLVLCTASRRRKFASPY